MEILTNNKSKDILLHVCCAPCATWSIEHLKNVGFQTIILYYTNSNIYPEEEYNKRLFYVRKLAEFHKIPLIFDRYDHKDWLHCCKHLSKEPEGGQRCSLCFEYNLRKTSNAAELLKIENFTTTLTISPYKNSKKIFAEGEKFSGFLPFDFKKNDGYKKSIEISKRENYYRQCYCGCEYSLIEMKKKNQRKAKKS